MKICEFCQTDFLPNRREQRFCNVTCASRWTATKRRSMAGAANPNFGRKHTQTTRLKMAQAARGRVPSMETRVRLSQLRSGVPKTDVWKQNISQALTDNPRIIEARQGERNPNFRHGKYVNERSYRRLVDLSRCSDCDATDGVMDVHHVDGDHLNNDITNLEVLCHTCHGKRHGRPRRIA